MEQGWFLSCLAGIGLVPKWFTWKKNWFLKGLLEQGWFLRGLLEYKFGLGEISWNRIGLDKKDEFQTQFMTLNRPMNISHITE